MPYHTPILTFANAFALGLWGSVQPAWLFAQKHAGMAVAFRPALNNELLEVQRQQPFNARFYASAQVLSRQAEWPAMA